jgi:hypothetical protein
MYAMVCTRPDIAQAVSTVSRFMSNPKKTALESSEVDLEVSPGQHQYEVLLWWQ